VSEVGPEPSAADRERETLGQARLVTAGLAAGVLILTALSGVVNPAQRVTVLVAPAALLGLAGLLVGYRLYARMRDAIPVDAPHGARCATFLRATIVALAVTEGAALLGVVAFWLSEDPLALVGVVTHLILVGAVWPTPERLESFVSPDAGSGGGG
jgi:hypothetical protein